MEGILDDFSQPVADEREKAQKIWYFCKKTLVSIK